MLDPKQLKDVMDGLGAMQERNEDPSIGQIQKWINKVEERVLNHPRFSRLLDSLIAKINQRIKEDPNLLDTSLLLEEERVTFKELRDLREEILSSGSGGFKTVRC